MNGATASCSVGVIVTITPYQAVLKPTQIDALAQAHLDGHATDAEVRFLETNQDAWVGSLWRLLDRAEEALASARTSVKGLARAHVLLAAPPLAACASSCARSARRTSVSSSERPAGAEGDRQAADEG